MDISIKDIKDKSETELNKLLREARKELRSLELKAATQELKDVRSIRTLRKHAARLMTRLTEVRNKVA